MDQQETKRTPEYFVKTSSGGVELGSIPVYFTGKDNGRRRIFEDDDGRRIAIGETNDGDITCDDPEWPGVTVVTIVRA